MTINKRNGNRTNNHRKMNTGTAVLAPPDGSRRGSEGGVARTEPKPVRPQITRQAIAEAAYFLWLKRGGNETVNWLEAEATLKRSAKQS